MKLTQNRPDLRAAQLGVASAQSQLSLAQANGKKDVNAQINYTHVAALSSASLFASIQLPIFDRNQGEIARTRQVITQSQELSSEQAYLSESGALEPGALGAQKGPPAAAPGAKATHADVIEQELEHYKLANMEQLRRTEVRKWLESKPPELTHV